MAKFWTLASTKGGCGKTTLAIILASEIVRNGVPVTLIDTDPNKPIQKLADKGNMPEALTCLTDEDPSGATLMRTLEGLRETPGFVIIDTEGTENLRTGLALQFSDLVIIPSKWSELDKDETLKVADYLNTVQATIKRMIPSVFVPSQVDTTFETANMRLVRGELEASGTRIIDPAVLNKDAYRAMFTQGRLLQDLETPSGSTSIIKARQNAEAVARNIALASVELDAAEAAQ